MRRSQALLFAGIIAVCLIAGSPPRIVGDGGEYLAQALNFAALHGPAISRRDMPVIEGQIAAFEPGLADWHIEPATVPGPDRRRDFLHFWVYALLATPPLWITTLLGAPPTFAFAALNLVLLGTALWVAWPRIGPAACLLIFAGPAIWWIDKIHTEIFTLSLLTIAFALASEQPWWAMAAAGLASTQNIPIAVLVPAIAGLAIVDHPARVKERRFQMAAAGALLLASLHPAYTYMRHGTPSLLLYATRAGTPTFAELSAVVLDPTIGLIGNDPVFLLVVAAGLVVMAWRQPSALLSRQVLLAAGAAALFLASFGRTANVHHGGTPSLSRYALWLLPLSVPLFAWGCRCAGPLWARVQWACAIASSLIAVFAFHPGVVQNSREPTWLATWLWTKHPSWNDPLPEVFSELYVRREETVAPVSTRGCEKVLLARDPSGHLFWPVPCYPAEGAARCLRVAACYANLGLEGYRFAPAPGRFEQPVTVERDRAWPPEAEPFVRRLYDDWQWPTMPINTDIAILRQAVNVSAIAVGRPDRFLLVLRGIQPGAALLFRPPAPMSGAFVDPRTGAAVRQVRLDPGNDPVPVAVPDGSELLVLTLAVVN
jgi:hypothetical protein